MSDFLLNNLKKLWDEKQYDLFDNAFNSDKFLEIINYNIHNNPEHIDNQVWKDILDITAHPKYLTKLSSDANRTKWADTVLAIIRYTNFSLLNLIEQRVEKHGNEILFQDPKNHKNEFYSYREIYSQIKEIAAVFYKHQKQPRVAIYSDNSVASANCDLACLAFDIFDSPFNIHFTTDQLETIFNDLKYNIAIVDTLERLHRLMEVRKRTNLNIDIFITSDKLNLSQYEQVYFLGKSTKEIDNKQMESLLNKRTRKHITEVATTMFTSGSTGVPKGVSFSIYNLVSKRFARHAALPQVGQHEVLLSFLPLFHTFGRYLEMLGAIYWRGKYVFAGNTSTETLLTLFPKINPTGFISIPLRWIQLYERIIDHSKGGSEITDGIVKSVLGANLKWGLSAAGYLSPKIFMFFHRHGVKVNSGFGMTEATGGITMTPPNDYQENSTGIPLPGVQTKLTDTGELLISGHYISRYLEEAGPGDTIPFPEDEEYWISTGDIFQITPDGHHRIVDRLKDIYKNNKGQTIAPRVIEQKFADVPGIKQTFLVGDAQPYNVLLIVPDNESPILIENKDKENINEYFHQIVTTANKEVANYERVVNFALLNRDFSAEHGELTPKGSFKRKKIEANYKNLIKSLYQKNHISLFYENFSIIIPRWFFRDLSVLEDDIVVRNNGLFNVRTKKKLTIQRINTHENAVRIGDLVYYINNHEIDLGTFARQPKLWVGNPQLISFSPIKVSWDLPTGNVAANMCLPENDKKIYASNELPKLNHLRDQNLIFINNLICSALHSNTEASLKAIKQIGFIFDNYDKNIIATIRHKLEALSCHPEEAVRVFAYRILLLEDPEPNYPQTFPAFIQSGKSFLTEDSIRQIALHDMGKKHLQSLRQRLHNYRMQLEWPANNTTRQQFMYLLDLLIQFGINYPRYYTSIRSELASWILHLDDQQISDHAKILFTKLFTHYEKAMEESTPAYSEEQWRQKIVFDSGIGLEPQAMIMEVLLDKIFLKQSVMLAFDEEHFDLSMVPDKGIWISRIRAYHQYRHYRISINTDCGKHFDLHMVMDKNNAEMRVGRTIYWLASLSGHPFEKPILPAFGCCRPNWGVRTTRYLSDLTAWEKIRAFAGRHNQAKSFLEENSWRKLFTMAMATFFRAWQDSNHKILPGSISPNNVTVAELDFKENASLVSLTGWEYYQNPLSIIKPLVDNFYFKTISHYPWCKNDLETDWIFDSMIEGMHFTPAMEYMLQLKNELQNDNLQLPGDKNMLHELNNYIERYSKSYYYRLAVHNAIDNYKQWATMNPIATPVAKEQTIMELLDLYHFERFPEVARYYLYHNTYFADKDDAFQKAFQKLIFRMENDLDNSPTYFIELSDLQMLIEEPADKKIFSKMVFPRLVGEKNIDILTIGDAKNEQLIVKTSIFDSEKYEYTFREPIDASEVGQLYQLFLRENYPKNISKEDRHLVVTDNNDRVIGGLCYKNLDTDVVFLDGSVITTSLQGKGIGSAMIEDFCARMAGNGKKIIKAHFLLGNFYLRLNFKVDKRWGALVRFLDEEDAHL